MKHVILTPDSPSRDVLAVNVRRLRLEQGLTLRQLAARIGRASHPLLPDMERGARAPALGTVDKLAAALGVTAAVLLTPPSADGVS